MRFYFLISVLAILSSCAPKYSEFNANGFGGGMSSMKVHQKMDVQVSVPQNQNKQEKTNLLEDTVPELQNSKPLRNDVLCIFNDQFKTNTQNSVFPSVIDGKRIKENKVELSERDGLQSDPFYNRYLRKLKQPRKTIVIIVAIGVILGLLGSLVSLGYILAGRAHVGGLGLAFSLGFAALFLLGLLGYDLDIAVAKFKKRGEYLKVFGLGLLRFIVILSMFLIGLGLVLGLALAR